MHRLLPIGILIALACEIGDASIGLDVQRLIVEPPERKEAFANPLKGWVVWGNAAPTTLPQPASLFFSYISWRELEPEEGVYAFESWENRWSLWLERDMKVIFRVYVDYPGRPSGLPQWLEDAGVETTRYEEYGGGWSPDYDHPLFVEKVQAFIAALGERYDRDPRVAFLDVGLLGHWGEWHTYPNTELFASGATQRTVMETFLESFSEKKMMLRYPSVWSARRDFGYRDDCFLTDTDGPESWMFFNRLRSTGADTVWMRQPIGGEFCGGAQGALRGTLEQPDECLRLIREGHFSHLGPAGGSIVAQSDEHQANLDEMLRSMGYRFVIRRAEIDSVLKAGEASVLLLDIENVGAAPFYYRWPLEIVFLDAEGAEAATVETEVDIASWLPGAHRIEIDFVAPALAMEEGWLALRVSDPSGMGLPARFANKGQETSDGAFILAPLRIESDACIPVWKSVGEP